MRLVYIRKKNVKGIKYAYLVRSVWDGEKRTSRQETIKYLGRASSIKMDDVPEKYRNDPNVSSYMYTEHSEYLPENEIISLRIREKFLNHLVSGNVDELFSICEKNFGIQKLTYFYDKIVTPSIVRVGELLANNEIDIATAQVCSNITTLLIKSIGDSIERRGNKGKVLICTPFGELHNLGCRMLETVLLNKGYKIFDMSPSLPNDSIIRSIEEIRPDVIFLSTTLIENRRTAQRLVAEISSRFTTPIIVGGRANYAIEGDGNKVITPKKKSFVDTVEVLEKLIKDKPFLSLGAEMN